MKRYSRKIGILGMVIVGFLLFIFIPFISRKIDKIAGMPAFKNRLTFGSGTILFLVGGALALWCILLFFIFGKATTFPLAPPQKLIIMGPYKYCRNPMMLGIWLMLIGEALFLGSVTLFLFILFIAIPGGFLFVIKYEEPDLVARFGDEYLEYKKSVPRWIPMPKFHAHRSAGE